MDTPSAAELWRRLTDDDASELADCTARVIAGHAADRNRLLPVDAWERE